MQGHLDKAKAHWPGLCRKSSRIALAELSGRSFAPATSLVGSSRFRLRRFQQQGRYVSRCAGSSWASCCALWMDDGCMPKYRLKTRLKCEELEKPQEKATSVIVL